MSFLSMMDFKRLVEFVRINISFIYKKYFKISVPVKLEKKPKIHKSLDTISVFRLRNFLCAIFGDGRKLVMRVRVLFRFFQLICYPTLFRVVGLWKFSGIKN